MKSIEQFIKRVFKHNPPKDQSIEQLVEMLEEKVEDLKEEGYDEEDAIDKTIKEFGDLEDYDLPDMEKEKRRHMRIKTIKHHRNTLLFSGISSALIIALSLFLNFVLFRDLGVLSEPWSPVVAIGVLFWPLSLLYKLLNKKGDMS